MILAVENLYTRIATATDDEMAWLSRYLTFPPENRPSAVPPSFLSFRYRSFPTGFLPLVRAEAMRQHVTVETLDKRARPGAPKLDADLAWLRDYQRESAWALLRGVRGLLWAPTGAGKTEVFVALALLLPAERFLVLVNQTDLLAQTAERFFARTGEVAGVVGDGAFAPRRFTVATFQTLYRKREDAAVRALLDRTTALVVDEVHVLPARSYYRVAMSARNAYFRWGVSGTPLARGDQKSVLAVASLGPVLYRIRPQPLIAAGVLSQPRIRMVPVRQEGFGQADDWNAVYKRAVVESDARNRAVVEAVRRARKPCLVFVKEIEHGRALEKRIAARGLVVEFVWGEDSTPERQAAVRRLRRGDTQVAICSVIWQQGIDIPEVRAIVVASGGRSAIATLQRLGRGMRVVAGKREVELWDFKDAGHKWLGRHTRARIAAYVAEGFEVHEWTLQDALDLGAAAPVEKSENPLTAAQ